MILRILADFEEHKGVKFRLLNSASDLESSVLVNNFLKLKNNSGELISNNTIYVRTLVAVETLQEIPTTVPIRDVKINVNKKEKNV